MIETVDQSDARGTSSQKRKREVVYVSAPLDLRDAPETFHTSAPPRLRWWRRPLLRLLYVPAIIAGMGITIGHLLKNLILLRQPTISFPEIKPFIPKRFRSRHRLMQKDDGSVRCTACMCCATACPSGCIYIVAHEVEDPEVEKAPRVFDIDGLKCVYCGFCVEACPCDAIRMDTGVYPEAEIKRGNFVWNMDKLMHDIPDNLPE